MYDLGVISFEQFLSGEGREETPARYQFTIRPEDRERYQAHIAGKPKAGVNVGETREGYQHLPEPVARDFKEALTCYSNLCPNATAAMCRRTIQSAAESLGVTGTDKVNSQILDIKVLAGIDDDTFVGLKQAMIAGHDGAHPHLPVVTQQRAAILVEVMKDVLYQLFVRQGKIKEAMKLRQEAIDKKKAAEAQG